MVKVTQRIRDRFDLWNAPVWLLTIIWSCFLDLLCLLSFKRVLEIQHDTTQNRFQAQECPRNYLPFSQVLITTTSLSRIDTDLHMGWHSKCKSFKLLMTPNWPEFVRLIPALNINAVLRLVSKTGRSMQLFKIFSSYFWQFTLDKL